MREKKGTKSEKIDKKWLLGQYLIQYRRALKVSSPQVCAKILENIGDLMKVDREVKNDEILTIINDLGKSK